jgi:cell division cycle 14
VYHCLKGLEMAIQHGWYNFREFDNKEYEYYEKIENGDLNFIIPNKFVAFMGPVDGSQALKRGANSPEDYLQIFKHFNVTHVVRLNEPKYDHTKFTKNGIKHTDLFFIDGSVPP